MNMKVELKINPKFRDLLDMPSESELKELERQLIRDKGPRDALKVWKGYDIIVDGHNRYSICQAHDLPFKVEYLPFKDESAVEEWILENQLARRNLTPARASYFLGVLYNKQKQDPAKVRTATEDGKSTAEKLSEQFGVSERTVRRAGDEAKGIDTVAQVKGLQSVKDKLAAIKDKNASFAKGELQELGKIADANPALAVETAKVMIEEKSAIAKAAEQVKKNISAAAPDKPQKNKTAAATKPVSYPVAFVKPEFDRIGWSVSSEERPTLTENAMVYMYVSDEELANGMDLLKKWGLSYEASFIFKCDRYEGTWSDVNHVFLLVGSKGTMPGPKKASSSMAASNGTVEGAMIKLIESYHPNEKRIDMRKRQTAEGWASPKSA